MCYRQCVCVCVWVCMCESVDSFCHFMKSHICLKKAQPICRLNIHVDRPALHCHTAKNNNNRIISCYQFVWKREKKRMEQNVECMCPMVVVTSYLSFPSSCNLCVSNQRKSIENYRMLAKKFTKTTTNRNEKHAYTQTNDLTFWCYVIAF